MLRIFVIVCGMDAGKVPPIMEDSTQKISFRQIPTLSRAFPC